MFASKLALVSIRSPCIGSALRSTILKLNNNVIRSYREGGGRLGLRKSRLNNVHEQMAPKSKGVLGSPLAIGEAVAATGGVLGLGALCFYGLGLSSEAGYIDHMYVWPDYVRARVRDTYLYFGTSVVAVAGSAVTIYRSAAGQKFFSLCARHPILSTIGIIAGLMGSSQAMMMIPYSPGLGSKQLMWLLNCGMIGLAVAPIGAFGGAIAIRAAWYTTGIIGGLSSVAMCAPSDKFMNWAGPLGIGLGGVVIASLGSMFIPPTSTLGLSLYSISLYGGLILFSAFLLYDTQRIMKSATSHPPPNMYDMRPYDPINTSHRLVMDAVNIFVRIAQILGMGGMNRKK